MGEESSCRKKEKETLRGTEKDRLRLTVTKKL